MIISRKGQRWIEHIIKMEVTFYDREIYSVIKGVFCMYILCFHNIDVYFVEICLTKKFALLYR